MIGDIRIDNIERIEKHAEFARSAGDARERTGEWWYVKAHCPLQTEKEKVHWTEFSSAMACLAIGDPSGCRIVE